MNSKKHIAIFASGNGSNAEKLMQYFQHHPSIKIELVICNNPNALVLEKAKTKQVESILISKAELKTSDKLFPVLEQHQINFIVLAGFLLQIPSWLTQKYQHHIINIHPSLLPKFGGQGMFGRFVHEAVIAAHETESGITIHFVNEKYDDGEIIFQGNCKVDKNETIESLANKIQQLEHLYLPKIIEQIIV